MAVALRGKVCGIVGYVGDREAWPIILEGLQRLEYRGYDSAGIRFRIYRPVFIFQIQVVIVINSSASLG